MTPRIVEITVGETTATFATFVREKVNVREVIFVWLDHQHVTQLRPARHITRARVPGFPKFAP